MFLSFILIFCAHGDCFIFRTPKMSLFSLDQGARAEWTRARLRGCSGR